METKEVKFEDIQKANETINTTNIKGKEYAEVNQRIKAFRMVYPQGSIITEMAENKDGTCIFRALIKDTSGNILGTVCICLPLFILQITVRITVFTADLTAIIRSAEQS